MSGRPSLPLAVRRRLWERTWARLLAPPEGDQPSAELLADDPTDGPPPDNERARPEEDRAARGA